MAALLDTVRQNFPAEIAGKKVVLYEDYLTASATAITGDKLPIDLPKENVLEFILEDNPGSTSAYLELSQNVNTILV